MDKDIEVVPASSASPGVNRRRFLTAAGAAGVGFAGASLIGTGAAAASAPENTAHGAASRPRIRVGQPLSTPRVAGVHLQFGADSASEVVVSWHSLLPVHRPRVLLGKVDGEFERAVYASTVTYTDAKSGQVVYAHHAALKHLHAATEYLYAAGHDGAEPEFATFTTGPRGRAAFTFTSFGDQGTPTTGKLYTPPAGVTIANPPFVNDNLGSPSAGDTTAGVEHVQPLFHLFNGDLCYANLAADRVRTWSDFWENNTRSARSRPWMPSAGNHENERGNGPIGYAAYQTYFSVPPVPGQTEATKGMWYSFTVGSVKVISLNNDDICYQDGGDSYVRGYSVRPATSGWRRSCSRPAVTAASTGSWCACTRSRSAPPTSSTARTSASGRNGCPLFDKYGVDLVVCGHEHHYERSHPIRGQQANADLDTDPGRDRHRGDRHQPRHRAHGHRRRRHLRTVEPTVVQPATLPRHHRSRRTRPDHRQTTTGLRPRRRTLVGEPGRRPRLRLCRIHRRSRHPPGRHHQHHSHLLRGDWHRRPTERLRNLHPATQTPRLSKWTALRPVEATMVDPTSVWPSGDLGGWTCSGRRLRPGIHLSATS